MKSYYRPEIRIGNKRIGFNNPCFIIAEVGSNHNKDLSVAKEAEKKGSDFYFYANLYESNRPAF